MYRAVSLFLTASFALVGLIFLLLPGATVTFFNGLSAALDMAGSPAENAGLFRILAVGYMYLVAALAFLMYRRPSEKIFPVLLIGGKLCTAAVSVTLFLTNRRYLLYIVNGVVDGLIALALIYLSFAYRRRRRRTQP